MGFAVVILTLFITVFLQVIAKKEGIIEISTKFSINELDEYYLSYGMDSNLIRNRWQTFDFNSVRLQCLAAGLGQAYMRLSGTDADKMIFVQSQDVKDVPPSPPTNFTMSTKDWDNINQWTKKVGWRIVFGFNAQLRNGSKWDPTNARTLLSYSEKMGYADNLDFELGNEPDLYGGDEAKLTGSQLGEDVKTLKNILETEFNGAFKKSFLVGPDVANGGSHTFMTEFINTAGDVLHAVTWHQYYGGAGVNNVANYTDPHLLDTYIPLTQGVIKTVKNSKYPDLRVWQGETASTYSPVGNNLPASYIAGVMLLDKLGLSASLGLKLVVRQTFYGFWFALVNEKLMPNPNYWVALMYSRLVGTTVLKVDVKGVDSQYVRVYAHCAKQDTTHSPEGIITMYVMNLGTEEVELKLGGIFEDSHIDEYLLTPGDTNDLESTTIRLNDKVIKMVSDNMLPEFAAKPLPAGSSFTLPPRSFAFYVVGTPSSGHVSVCKS